MNKLLKQYLKKYPENQDMDQHINQYLTELQELKIKHNQEICKLQNSSKGKEYINQLEEFYDSKSRKYSILCFVFFILGMVISDIIFKDNIATGWVFILLFCISPMLYFQYKYRGWEDGNNG